RVGKALERDSTSRSAKRAAALSSLDQRAWRKVGPGQLGDHIAKFPLRTRPPTISRGHPRADTAVGHSGPPVCSSIPLASAPASVAARSNRSTKGEMFDQLL